MDKMAEQGHQPGRLTASVIMSSDIVYDLYCEVCNEDGQHLEAEGFCVDCQDYLCKDCFKGHRRSRACRNHVLQDKTQMPHTRPPPSLAKPSTGTCTEKCANHPDRLVEYYCRDDRSLGCSVCMTMNHRLCTGVDHIPDLSENLLDSPEYKKFTNALKTLKTNSQGMIKNSKVNVSKAEQSFTDAAKTLQALRISMNEAFDKLEQDMTKKAETIKSTDIKKMKDIVEKANRVFNEVQKISADLQSLQSKNQLGQVFIQMIKLEDTVETLHKLLNDANDDNHVTAYTFQASTQIQEILDDPASIGKISVQASARASSSPSTQKDLLQKNPRFPTAAVTSPPITKDPKNIKAEFVYSIMVMKTKIDAKKKWISGSVLLPGNKLIITDHGNHKVKLIDLQTSKVTSELKTSSGPWDITNIAGDQVAVTLINDSKIVFVKVTDNLTVDREMPVDGKCTAILHGNGKMFVAFENPKKIEIMALDGTLERKIEKSDLFLWPSHMALSSGQETIYVADRDGKCVKRITLSGAVQAIYKDQELSTPRGLTVDQHGRVLVCGGTSHNIHLLNPDLTKIKVLVSGLNCPQSVSYCHNTGRLYVGMHSECVRVYQLT